jgi:hypothetical protein
MLIFFAFVKVDVQKKLFPAERFSLPRSFFCSLGRAGKKVKEFEMRLFGSDLKIVWVLFPFPFLPQT